MKIHVAHKAFATKVLFRDFALSWERGQFIALTGASGVGKTTLLRMLAGLDTQWQGEISGGTLGTIGFMFQEPRLMPWLSARDNIALMTPDHAYVDELLRRVGLADAADKYPNQLSGGMQRRVALARAMTQRPDVLLMDEPFTSLDAATARGCRDLLEQLCREFEPTVLLVSHDLEEMLSLASRVVVLGGEPVDIIEDIDVEAWRLHQDGESPENRLRPYF
jgi:NitT/TauT family transport system ATP-binding protein